MCNVLTSGITTWSVHSGTHSSCDSGTNAARLGLSRREGGPRASPLPEDLQGDLVDGGGEDIFFSGVVIKGACVSGVNVQ